MQSLLQLLSLFILTQTAVIAQKQKKALSIIEQGSFMVGGIKQTTAGQFDVANALQPEGQTFHADHAYVFYQIPTKPKKYSLVFLHGAGQSKKTWETTSDGRDGFQNLFLRRSYPVYLVDQPRRGEAGRSSTAITINPVADEQFWFTQFRLGNYPNYFPNVQFPQDENSLEQFFRQMTPNTGAFGSKVVANSLSKLFDRIGQGILITHSQGGGPGWMTAINNKLVKGIVAYEPYSGFVFPEGELPDPISSTGLFGPLKGVAIPKEDFLKLTKIPIVVYYGDNIATTPTTVWNMDHWRSGLEMAQLWASTINKYGGDAKVVHLPTIGIYGNTHFPFSDLNNEEIASILEKWLKEKDLY